MKQVRLGRSELMVTPLAIGTMTFGLQCDEPTSRAILDAAIEGGINFVDTADVYPLGSGFDLVGRTEEIVGRWLKDRRAEVVVATKCGKQTSADPADEGTGRERIIACVEASLRRLQVERIDLFYVHRDYASIPLDETLEALDRVVRAGKVRYVGLSNFLAYRAARALGRAEANGFAAPVAVQNRYSLVFRQFERELLPLCRDEGLGFLAYNPLAGGLLTGKYDRSAPPVEGGRFTLGNAAEDYQARYWKDREFDTIEALRPIAAEAGMSLATLAIAWVLSNAAVTSVLVGASRPEQLKDAFAAAERAPLPEELKARLDALTHPWRMGDAVR